MKLSSHWVILKDIVDQPNRMLSTNLQPLYIIAGVLTGWYMFDKVPALNMSHFTCQRASGFGIRAVSAHACRNMFEALDYNLAKYASLFSHFSKDSLFDRECLFGTI